MKKISKIRVYSLAIIVSLGLALSFGLMNAAEAAPDGPLLTILNHTSVVDFGRQNIGEAGLAETITVANSGSPNLEIQEVGIIGNNPESFNMTIDNCSGRILTPGQTCTVTINFAPLVAGERSARLSIANNAAGNNHLIPLTGVGVDASTVTRDVGPIDVRHGFPLWYQDDTGVRVALCLDANDLCLGPLPDPSAQVSVNDRSINFPGETFWFSAEAEITRANGGKALLVLAKEAAFATDEEPTPGQQLSFDRLRIRLDRLTPGRSYKVTHPFGVMTLVADSRGEINYTSDVGCAAAPCDFRAALNGRIGVFLRWDPAVAPLAPAGYLGDPNVNHKVTGSPLGTNFFRVEGTNIGGTNVNLIQTDLFAVEGKLFQ